MIIFCHLLNDRSGSPRVLSAAMATLKRAGEEVCLFVGSEGAGFLDELNVPTKRYWYRRGASRLVTLVTYLASQMFLFFSLLRTKNLPCGAIVYVNTLLPVGAALFGKITGRPVIYHLHEVSITPAPLRWLLVNIAKVTAQQLIYVSDFHRRSLPIGGVVAYTIPNALDAKFLQNAEISRPYRPRRNGCFRVLMLASLRDYKGIPEFVSLAKHFQRHEGVTFHLVANDEKDAVERYFVNWQLPPNLVVYPRTDNPSEHYAQASLVVNLSRPDKWVETFGLTLIEAMAYGVPVIAPPVGGPVELITNEKEGFLVDSRNMDELIEKVGMLINNEALCLSLSSAAKTRAMAFSPERFGEALQAVLSDLRKAQG